LVQVNNIVKLLMENFNKNWLIILLIAVVFLILGFLLGRVTGHHHGGRMERRMMQHGKGERMMHLDNDSGKVTIRIDTISNDGQKMEIRVEKKIGKKENK
jgi:hypothetical protein